MLLTAAIVGCSSDSQVAATARTVRGDSIIVDARRSDVRTGTLVEELSIGQGSGFPEYTFGSIDDIAVRSDGAVFILDGSVPIVRQFDSEGRYVRAIGRAGDGPGEYRDPGAIDVFPDGGLLINDPRAHRINRYDSAGVHVAEWPLPRGQSGLNNALVVMKSGQTYVKMLFLIGFQPTPEQEKPPVKFLRLAADGSIIDTIADPVFPEIAPIITNAAGHRHFKLPFAPTTTWTLSRQGYFVTGQTGGADGEYSFELRLPPALRDSASRSATATYWKLGDTLVSIRARYEPVASLEQERADYRAMMESAIRFWDPAWSWSGPEIPKEKAPYKSLWTDNVGRIWVQISTAAQEDKSITKDANGAWASRRWAEPITYDVFEPTGQLVGRVNAPVLMMPEAAFDERVWALTLGADDIIVVRRYRIVW